ncbi:hypothetical protein [Sulfitobacter noctilucae]|uniref:hypothetical protein n=1 Tax=Sulfitobacter noctilucae TaxID=1342302 RepID=UPI00046A6694|nr:hypothetical protein [Sulfitobacter noctilucae]
MTNFNDDPERAEILLHDLRAFLHNAHDQHRALTRISEAIAKSSNRIEGQEATNKRILQTLRKQIDMGVNVHIDADLQSHVARVKAATDPVSKGVERISQTMRHFTLVVASVASASSFAGAIIGVLSAFRFL